MRATSIRFAMERWSDAEIQRVADAGRWMNGAHIGIAHMRCLVGHAWGSPTSVGGYDSAPFGSFVRRGSNGY